jgi:integrase
MLALTRADVDLLHHQVRVRASASEITGSGRLVGPTKTDAGLRTVSLPRVASEALEDHLGRFGQPGADGAVFTGPRGGPLRRADLSAEWRAAAAGVDGAPEGLHVHDLRHAGATMMARMPGVTTKELMARIGHASPRAALIYQHATEERDRAVADYLDEQVSEAVAAAAAGSGATVTPLRAR